MKTKKERIILIIYVIVFILSQLLLHGQGHGMGKLVQKSSDGAGQLNHSCHGKFYQRMSK